VPLHRSVAIGLGCLLATLAPAAAKEAQPEPSRWLEIQSYESSGPFVSVPAKIFGMTTLVLVGGAAAVVCMPFDLVHGLIHLEGYGEIAEDCASEIGQTAASGTYLATGAPFWLVKRLAWDAPRELFSRAPEPERIQPDLG
jgi:hypothetical protein